LHAGREATYANLAEVLREQDRPEEAIAAYRAAVALRSDRAVTHNNMGSCHMALARPAQAIPCFRTALTVDPEYAVGHYNLGSALLMHGELAEGWQEFEWRWSVEPARNAQRTFAQPQWRGEPAA